MKKIFFIIAIALAMTTGCTDQVDLFKKNNLKHEQVELRSQIPNFTSFNIPFPQGTTFDLVGSELKFTLPQPYYIVGVDESGEYYRSTGGGSGGVTCECTKGSGCDPIKSGGDYGCLMKNGCSSCNKSKGSITGVSNKLVEFAIFNPDYNMFVDEFNQLDGKFLLHHSLIEIPEVSDLVQELEANFLESETKETKIAFINAYGYILPLEIPSDIDNTSLYLASNGGDGGEVCGCNVDGKCPKDRKFTVVWCNSDNCTSCSMSGIVVNADNETRQFSENGGLITLK